MSAVGLESIDHTVLLRMIFSEKSATFRDHALNQLTHIWINELDTLLGWDSKSRSFRLLRTVLQALRDWLPVNEAVDLGAQLPMLLRGVYYERWRPATTTVRERHKANFLARVDDAFRTDPISFTPDAVSAVFQLLSDKIGAGEIDDVRHALPADLRALWPARPQAA